ncbi:MAG: acyl-CoA thioesterase [Bdellovibrio sp.]
MFGKNLIYSFEVQFEDVDFGGAVHNPNYLKYFERARNFHLKEAGISTKELMAQGFCLAVAETYIKYLKPISLEQKIKILTKITGIKKVGLRIEQVIFDQANNFDVSALPVKLETATGALTFCRTKLVCADLKRLRPAAFPENLAAALMIPNELPEEGSSQFTVYGNESKRIGMEEVLS